MYILFSHVNWFKTQQNIRLFRKTPVRTINKLNYFGAAISERRQEAKVIPQVLSLYKYFPGREKKKYP